MSFDHSGAGPRPLGRDSTAPTFFDVVAPRTRVIGTGGYLPEQVVTNTELEARLPTTAEWIKTRTGIEQRHIAAPDEATSDMAAVAARRAIEASGLTVADLDLIILATSTPDSPLPASAAHLQHKLGADLIPAFDLNASAAGFLYGLTIGDQFISAGTYKTVLVVGADLMSRVTQEDDRTAAALFGDGAGAVVLVPALDDGRGILSSKIQADGMLASLMQLPGGGSAEPLTEERLAEGRQYLRLDGKKLYEISIRHLTSYSMQALKAARLTSAELDWVVPQQGNLTIVTTISERLGFPLEKFVLTLADTGNTQAASIPIALDEAVRDGRIQAGHNVLMCALGAGISWGTMMIRM
ncbi:MAG: 3-oxoacyl-ACP synthase [Deltaproteobacteria bacterium]|nr:MAG: 3-oxoacyl-ACP synthase [Deltaproteobacteria bacterium]